MNNEAVVTIFLMALATAATRLGGFWLMGKVEMSPFIKRFLDNLPGSLVLAIVTPALLSGNLTEPVAAAFVILTMIFTKNLLLAMIAGSAVVFLIRIF